MTSCTEFEVLLSDYIDGTLSQAVRDEMERHMAGCVPCAEMYQDARAAVKFIGTVRPIAPPPDLITRIAYQAPRGPMRDPLQRRGLFGLAIGRWLQPVLQPRFAMGMAMTILSFAMLERCTGIQVQHIRPADLNPVHVWDGFQDRVLRTRDRAVKYYENLLVVYDVESRLRALQEDNSPPAQSQPASKKQGNASKAQSNVSKLQSSGSNAKNSSQTKTKKGDQSK
ncbi:MAG TPA: anti-sigma factor [Bryobacteraceae bacterium]|nr:anti-sigma factor [Bryobacteraceae bacterium]